MLENGEYPSFAEIGYFQSQGYNFAIYEQSIIIPEMRGYSTNIWKYIQLNEPTRNCRFESEKAMENNYLYL